ncbi:MAG: type I-C CRISPR-associated protein Cas8c/Csd1 [Magnetococcales bacterium]|nr:type I-C CRISPR-associated protein Cas8c/Csd1 [Magnetococcales bacterium]
MGWMQKLYETYNCSASAMLPVSHTKQQAHIEITIDMDGNFKRAKVIDKEETLIPATEQSAGRTGQRPPPHPLCDKVQYCAADYPDFGGAKLSFFKDYETLLNQWCQSEFSHPKARAVLTAIQRRNVVSILVREKILFVDANNKLPVQWTGEGDPPKLYALLQPKKDKNSNETVRDQGDAFIRWRVEESGRDLGVWEDPSLIQAWTAFDASTNVNKGVCMVSGAGNASLALNHPKRIRHSGDGAKLISANDASGYTFRGRFTDNTGQQGCGIGHEVSQKAHSALRWLIEKQSYRNGDQVIVSWAVSGAKIPDPFVNTMALLDPESQETDQDDAESSATGEHFARRLALKMAGYRAELGNTHDIVVMGLDSATPGRMSIVYYRELAGSEFLDRIESWHDTYQWHQDFGKEQKFIGVPSPKEIAEAAYGRRLDDKLRKATVERLLPCIIDGLILPQDLMDATVRRVCNRTAYERDKQGRQWEWEKHLGIACALYRGYQRKKHNEEFAMALEKERTTRDYLFGRLLAVADHMENRALYLAQEKRESNASRLMQRFADHPSSTWRTIELSLAPYKSRLQAKRGGFLHEMNGLLDEIINAFDRDAFVSDDRLSGEFLLGFHTQRHQLKARNADTTTTESEDADSENQ